MDKIIVPDLFMELHVTLSSSRLLIEGKGSEEHSHLPTSPQLWHGKTLEKVFCGIVHGYIASLKLQSGDLKKMYEKHEKVLICEVQLPKY